MDPELSDLIEFSRLLRAADVTHALGGSGLLRLSGIPVVVNDWDITTDECEERIERVIAGRQYEKIPSNNRYISDYLFRINEYPTPIDLIGGFTIRKGRDIVKLNSIVTGEYRHIPLGCLNEWLYFYQATGQFDKAELITKHKEGRPNR